MSFQIHAGDSVVSGDFSRLEKLIAQLKTKHYVDIGVFKTAKTPDGQQIAKYGAYNEFGSYTRPDHPPKRSFIRMPLTTKQERIEAYVQKRMRAHLEAGDVKAIFKDIGIGGESVIQEAFDTRGFGTWKENADSTILRKTVNGKAGDAPLIDDGTLRKSIGSRVG